MLHKNKYVLAGIGAAAVAVLSVGGYFLHRKVLKYRLREQARKQAMNLAMFDLNDGEDYYGDYDHDGDGESETDYCDDLFGDFDKDGFYNRNKDVQQGADKE